MASCKGEKDGSDTVDTVDTVDIHHKSAIKSIIAILTHRFRTEAVAMSSFVDL